MGSGTEILAFTGASNTCKKQLAQVGARLGPMLCCALRSEAHATVAYSGPSTTALARAEQVHVTFII